MEEKAYEDGAETNVKIFATKMRVMQPQAKEARVQSQSTGVALLTPTQPRPLPADLGHNRFLLSWATKVRQFTIAVTGQIEIFC